MTPIRTIMDDVIAIANELGLKPETNEPYDRLVERILNVMRRRNTNRSKAWLQMQIDRLNGQLREERTNTDRARADAREARAETARVLEQKPELEAFRDFARELDIDQSGSIEEVLDRATTRFRDLQEKNEDCARCDECGEKTEHHFCGGHYSDPLAALHDILAELETPARDETERRLQREAIERIAEEHTGQTINLRRAS